MLEASPDIRARGLTLVGTHFPVEASLVDLLGIDEDSQTDRLGAHAVRSSRGSRGFVLAYCTNLGPLSDSEVGFALGRCPDGHIAR